MKLILSNWSRPLAAVIMIVLAGCQQADKSEKQQASQRSTPAVVSAMTEFAQAQETKDTQAAKEKRLAEQMATKRKYLTSLPTKTDQYTILFDINSNQLNTVYQGELVTLAEHLNKNPEAKIHVDGFTCELGSSEYNVALGQRRAQAVARFLEKKGVKKEQIIVVSYGKERPADPLHNELAWMKNRRVEVFF